MPLSPGDLLATKYRIEAEIGRGAFGRVYRARDIDLDRGVAIKELHRGEDDLGSTQFSDYVRRFEREARVQARFNHPNIVHVYELLRLADDRLYLVMEFVDGENLRDYLARRGPLPVDEAVRITADILAGLAAVHADERDIVHRDIKPSNVMLTRSGQAKLADFGLAQVGDESMRSGAGRPHPGSPMYMSPEQETTSAYLYPASDAFSAGCVLFELLTGVVYKQAKRRKQGLADLRPDAPAWLAEATAAALAKDPDDRPADAGALARRLREGEAQVKAELEAKRKAELETKRQAGLEAQAEWRRREQEAEQARRRQEEERRQAEAKARADAEALERARLAAERQAQAAAAERAQRAAEAQQAFEQGKAYYNKQDYDHAAAEFTRALELVPDQAEYWRWRGWCYNWQGDHDRAIADYTRAIQLDPIRADYYLERGISHHLKGDYDRAIAHYTRAIELNPNKADYYRQRGLSYHAKGDYDRAIADHSQAIQLDPKKADYYRQRSVSYNVRGDYDRAIADDSRAIELDPHKADYYFQRGLSHGGKRDFDCAIADFTWAIELDPNQAAYYLQRGVSYGWKGDYDRAIADHTRAIELDPNKADYYSTRGSSYHNQKFYTGQGNYERAIADKTWAIELDPKNGEYYHSRSLTYRAMGNTARAEADAAQARELGYKE